MGTDIHVVAQVREKDGFWRDIDAGGYDIEPRNYSWFTFLCGVRADITNDKRKEAIKPIAEPRGAPDGFVVKEPEPGSWDVDTYYGDKWMGYGITSWVTLAEILEHEKTLPNPMWPGAPDDIRIGPIDALEELFEGHEPKDCRIVFGFDS